MEFLKYSPVPKQEQEVLMTEYRREEGRRAEVVPPH